MKNSSLVSVMGAIAIAAHAWHLIDLVKLKRQAGPLKAQAKEQFLQTESNVSESRYCFQGATAKIIREEEFGPIRGILSKKTNYTLTIYATNEAGEFFVFRSSPVGQGRLKHMPPKIARAVLKDQYVPPHGADG
jgi:hypothetical protein